MALANRMEQLRKQRGWSLAEVARKLDLKYTTYVGYEKGEREPGHLFLISIAKLYDVSVDYLLEIESDSYPEINSPALMLSETHASYQVKSLSASETELLALWRESSSEGQEAAKVVLKAHKKTTSIGCAI